MQAKFPKKQLSSLVLLFLFSVLSIGRFEAKANPFESSLVWHGVSGSQAILQQSLSSADGNPNPFNPMLYNVQNGVHDGNFFAFVPFRANGWYARVTKAFYGLAAKANINSFGWVNPETGGFGMMFPYGAPAGSQITWPAGNQPLFFVCVSGGGLIGWNTDPAFPAIVTAKLQVLPHYARYLVYCEDTVYPYSDYDYNDNGYIVEVYAETCANGYDDDNDGLVDLSDPGCSGNPYDNDEWNPAPAPTPVPPTATYTPVPPTAIATATQIPTGTATMTPLPTNTSSVPTTPNATPTNRPRNTRTPTPIPSATRTYPGHPTLTPTAAASATSTRTPVATNTAAPTATAIVIPTSPQPCPNIIIINVKIEIDAMISKLHSTARQAANSAFQAAGNLRSLARPTRAKIEKSQRKIADLMEEARGVTRSMPVNSVQCSNAPVTCVQVNIGITISKLKGIYSECLTEINRSLSRVSKTRTSNSANSRRMRAIARSAVNESSQMMYTLPDTAISCG